MPRATLYLPPRFPLSPVGPMRISRPLPLVALLSLPLLAACSSHYSPDTYNAGAVQQAAKVDRGIVVGVRAVGVSANTTTGAVTGAAAGGIAGSQVGAGGAASAFGALGGTVIGGLVGSTIEHNTADAPALEYVVRKPNGDLISVTQQNQTPIPIGAKVLVIAGPQARIVPDYTAEPQPEAKPAAPAAAIDAAPAVTTQDLLRGVPAAPPAPTPSTPTPSTGAPSAAPTPLAPPAAP